MCLCEAPLCPNRACSAPTRLVPIDSSMSAIMCADCYANEMDYNETLPQRFLPPRKFEELEVVEDFEEELMWLG